MRPQAEWRAGWAVGRTPARGSRRGVMTQTTCYRHDKHVWAPAIVTGARLDMRLCGCNDVGGMRSPAAVQAAAPAFSHAPPSVDATLPRPHARAQLSVDPGYEQLPKFEQLWRQAGKSCASASLHQAHSCLPLLTHAQAIYLSLSLAVQPSEPHPFDPRRWRGARTLEEPGSSPVRVGRERASRRHPSYAGRNWSAGIL